MSNHYHIVVRIGDASTLDRDAVIARWLQLYQGPLIVHRYLEGELLSAAELATVGDIAAVWRKRLGDLSWFMKCLNEPIARQANREDECSGHFWEARFKSQALHTDQALLACMTYVDLNPIRAGLASTPEASDYTSVQQRIQSILSPEEQMPTPQPPERSQPIIGKGGGTSTLLHFEEGNGRAEEPRIPVTLREYLALVDWTGRYIKTNKRGFIARQSPQLLDRLGLSPDAWSVASSHFEDEFRRRYAQKR
jgi:hypothetical protein